MLIFDAMCFDALFHMYEEGLGEGEGKHFSTLGAIMAEHIKFHNWLPFTTEMGKYMKLLEVLAELQFPECVCLQEAYDLVMMAEDSTDKSQLNDRLFSSFADKYWIYTADETALLLRKDKFRRATAQLSGSDGVGGECWRARMLLRGEAKHGGTKLFEEWKTTLARTCVVRAHLAQPPSKARGAKPQLRPQRWRVDENADPEKNGASESPRDAVPVILCAVHGKGGSDVTDTFIPELSDVMGERVKDVAAFVVGMDSNTSDAERFRSELLARGIMATQAVDPETKTVAKARTLFQTQVKKTGVLDVSLKDFIVAWKADDGAGAYCWNQPDANEETLRPLVDLTEQYPEIDASSKDGDGVSMLMPTAQWPFDHAMVLAQVNV